MEAEFFASPDEMRQWLGANHESADELWLGLYKKGSGKGGITLGEAQVEALCFGRFTPRRPNSNWAAISGR